MVGAAERLTELRISVEVQNQLTRELRDEVHALKMQLWGVALLVAAVLGTAFSIMIRVWG